MNHHSPLTTHHSSLVCAVAFDDFPASARPTIGLASHARVGANSFARIRRYPGIKAFRKILLDIV